jgi:hypothetical protein
MSSSKIVMTMAMLILVFLFGGLMLGFILQSEGVLEETSGRVIINDQATLAQLATHVALRAYNCNNEGGGQWEALNAVTLGHHGYKQWDDWRSYLEYANSGTHPTFTFEDLKDSVPGNIQCSGTASTLPFQDKSLLQGVANYVTDSHWGNDQEGRYGRMKFKFNETLWVGGNPSWASPPAGCYGLEVDRDDGMPAPDALTDMWISVTDENDYNGFNWNTGFFGGQNCHPIGEPASGLEEMKAETGGIFDSQQGAWLTLTVIGEYEEERDASGDFTIDGHDLEESVIKICEGATGYIQANTGKDAGDAPYMRRDPPGEHGEQVGGNAGTDNYIHLFMVVNNGDGC